MTGRWDIRARSYLASCEILGLENTKGHGHATGRRFVRRIERLHQLPRRDQQAILGTIGAFLAKVP
jgi:hypothetical protein